MITELENKIETLKKQKKSMSYKIMEIECKIKELENQIEEQKILKNLPVMIEQVKKIDTNNIFTDDEIKKIYLGMDKSDYSDVGIEGWLDVDKLTKTLIKIKNKYQSFNFILDKVIIKMSYDSYPPQNIYSFTFYDKDKERITIN